LHILQHKMKKALQGNIVLLNTFALLVCMLFSACASSAGLSITNSSLTAREFTDNSNVKQSMAAVTGQVRNVSQATIQNVKTKVIFYDSQKQVIGEAATIRESISAGETWSFTVQLTNSDAWKARSYDISVFSY
jgi:hypothetical protein